MSIWDAETTILRLMAVVFVFALLRIGGRGKETGRETVLYLTVVVASAAVNLIRSGGGGFLLALSGALVSFAITAPLIIRGDIRIRDIAAPVAAGSLLGPWGGPAAIAIAAAIYLLHRSPCYRPLVMDRLAVERNTEAAAKEVACRSVIAMIETRKINRGSERRRESGQAQDTLDIRRSCAAMAWKTSLAVATLAILLTGMFV